MKIIPTELPEVLIIEPDIYRDERGFFMESHHARKFAEHGLNLEFVQDNHSRSKQGVLRGLHFQLQNPQGKLVRVASGEVFDVAVDVRKGSPSFGRWVGVTLSEENNRQLYIPPGFAHGFCTLSDSADLLYKCTDFYQANDEYGVIWNDPDVGIKWPSLEYRLSKKDRDNPRLRDLSKELPVYSV